MGSEPVFDLVAEDEAGAGVAGFGGGEVLAEFADCRGGPRCWEWVQPASRAWSPSRRNPSLIRGARRARA